jgi:ABC-2 type transport system ATP-binding protein
VTLQHPNGGGAHSGDEGVTLALDPGVDALAVLERAAQAGRVVDFGLELPPLSQLFREAVQS